MRAYRARRPPPLLLLPLLAGLVSNVHGASVNLVVTGQTADGKHSWKLWPSYSQCPCQWGDVAGVPVVSDPPLGCSVPSANEYAGKVVIVDRGECSFLEKGLNAQKAGALAVIVADYSNATGDPPMAVAMASVTIPFALVKFADGQMMKDLAEGVPAEQLVVQVDGCPCFHSIGGTGSQVLTWAIGVLTTVLGAYLAGSHERAVAKGLSYEDLERNRGGGQEGDGQQEISMPMAFGFMVVASCMLVVLFFLHEYLSKAIVILYTLGSCGAMLHVLCTAVRGCAPSIGREMREVPLLGDVSGLSLMLSPLAIGAALGWYLFRTSSCAWLLQNFMSFSLCIQIMGAVRINCVRTCAALLSLMFFYDIFWVFLSGYFFKQSVMIVVATGGKSGESLPMLFAVPHECGYSMLGLGDIVIPSLLLCLSLRLDYANDIFNCCSPNGYFFVNALGYAVGLGFADVAVQLTGMGQPALLYLVPCTLGPVMLRAQLRGEFKWVWDDPLGESTQQGGVRVDYAEAVDYDAHDDWGEKVSLVQPRDVRSF